MVNHRRHVRGKVGLREDTQHRSLVRQCRGRSRRGLFDDVSRAVGRHGEEDAVPSRGVDDREALLHHDLRVDKPEGQEIVGDV